MPHDWVLVLNTKYTHVTYNTQINESLGQSSHQESLEGLEVNKALSDALD